MDTVHVARFNQVLQSTQDRVSNRSNVAHFNQNVPTAEDSMRECSTADWSVSRQVRRP